MGRKLWTQERNATPCSLGCYLLGLIPSDIDDGVAGVVFRINELLALVLLGEDDGSRFIGKQDKKKQDRKKRGIHACCARTCVLSTPYLVHGEVLGAHVSTPFTCFMLKFFSTGED